jgi:hypothetical protein
MAVDYRLLRRFEASWDVQEAVRHASRGTTSGHHLLAEQQLRAADGAGDSAPGSPSRFNERRLTRHWFDDDR